MSKQFYIKPKNKSALEKIQEMTLTEFLDYLDRDFLYSQDEENMPEFFQEKIANKVIDLVVPDITCRGFSFNIENDEMEVYINTPSSTGDWQLCLSFMQTMQEKLNAVIFDEERNKITLLVTDHIFIKEMDYEQDILSGIKSIQDLFKEESQGNVTLLSASGRQIEISQQMINDVLESDDVIDAFDAMLEKVFHSTAYFSKQLFYKIDDEIVGGYVIGDDYDVVIPKQPDLSFENAYIKEEYGGVSRWVLFVAFSDENEESLELDYTEAIEKITGYKELDVNQIEISAKTIEELKAMFKR